MAVAPEGLKKTERDPSGINSHIALSFEEVFAEPVSVQSCDCVWKGARGCFNGSRTCCYNILSGCCGMCQALCTGCDFACTTFRHVWCYTPQFRLCKIGLHLLGRCWRLYAECCLAPCCDQLAKISAGYQRKGKFAPGAMASTRVTMRSQKKVEIRSKPLVKKEVLPGSMEDDIEQEIDRELEMMV